MKCWHWKRQDESKTVSATQDTCDRFIIHFLALRDGLADLMKAESARTSTDADLQNAVQQVNASGMPRIPCFVTDVAEISLRFVETGGWSTVSYIGVVLLIQRLFWSY